MTGYERLLAKIQTFLVYLSLKLAERCFYKFYTSNRNDRNDDVSNDGCNESRLSNSVSVYMTMLANDLLLVECS